MRKNKSATELVTVDSATREQATQLAESTASLVTKTMGDAFEAKMVELRPQLQQRMLTFTQNYFGGVVAEVRETLAAADPVKSLKSAEAKD